MDKEIGGIFVFANNLLIMLFSKLIFTPAIKHFVEASGCCLLKAWGYVTVGIQSNLDASMT